MTARYLALPASTSARHERAWSLRWRLSCSLWLARLGPVASWGFAHMHARHLWAGRLALGLCDASMFCSSRRLLLAERLVGLRATWLHRSQAQQARSGGGWGGTPGEHAEGGGSQQRNEATR